MRPGTSSCSSASSSPSPPASPLTAGKSMEDVWQGINLGFLRPPPLTPSSADPAARSSSVFHFGILPDRNPREPIGPNTVSSPAFPSLGSNLKYGSSTPPLVFPTHGKGSRAEIGGEKRSPAGEQWQKRRMKNRESAARSRARKQETSSAYTQELENEVDRLKMENAKLRSILNEEEEHFDGAGGQPPKTKRNTLCRSLTAPF